MVSRPLTILACWAFIAGELAICTFIINIRTPRSERLASLSGPAPGVAASEETANQPDFSFDFREELKVMRPSGFRGALVRSLRRTQSADIPATQASPKASSQSSPSTSKK